MGSRCVIFPTKVFPPHLPSKFFKQGLVLCLIWVPDTSESLEKLWLLFPENCALADRSTALGPVHGEGGYAHTSRPVSILRPN